MVGHAASRNRLAPRSFLDLNQQKGADLHVNQPATTSSPTSDPRNRILEIRFQLRSDLQVSRQVYQHRPVYVIHDPVSFRTHRLSVEQYRILALLSADQTVGENFERLVARGEFSGDQEEAFCQLVSSLARLGLIVLPGTSGGRLYDSYRQHTALKRRSRLLSVLFLQIPLVNPDAFLSRTVHRFSWLFTRSFLLFWMLGLLAAGVVICSRFHELIQPLNGLLAGSNLPFLWCAFVVLKIWHELGHGYACRTFGGSVPEMGTILIAGTPAAYVDATSAWSFPERSHRLVVMCGGMFFESLIFIPSVFVWAFAASPMLQSCAWQLIVMTSLVTLLFNANPLMKFDGYFILCELIGIQNLRPAADAQIKRVLTSGFLGVSHAPSTDSVAKRIILLLYGVAAMVYRILLMVSIAVVVALKFPVVGLLMAVFHLFSTLVLGSGKLANYLLKNPETDAVRGRARLVAGAIFLGLPLAACLIPVPFGVVAQGIIGAETEHFVNVTSPGSLDATPVVTGHEVSTGDSIVRLSNPQTLEQLQIAEASLREAVVRRQVAHEQDPALAAEQHTAVTELRQRVAEYEQVVQDLTIASPASGRLVRLIPATERGRYLSEGHPLAVVVTGRPMLRTWVNEDQLGSLQTQPGTEVTFRIAGRSTSTYRGQIVNVRPAAEISFDATMLTQATGGSVLINPETGQPLQPVFQIDILPESDVVTLTEHGARVSLNLSRRPESIAAWATRRCVRFVHELLTT